MNNIENTLADIIKNLVTNPLKPIRERNLVGMISKGDGYYIYTNQQIEQKIIEVADRMYKQNNKVHETHLLSEWRSIFRTEFGRSFPSHIDNTNCFEAEAKKLRRRIEEELTNYNSEYDSLKTAYGCWLFTHLPKEPIEIGPVRFVGTHSWLDKALEYGEISKTTHSRLSRAFDGKSLKKRKPSHDAHYEEIIQGRLSNAPLVCEVMTHGLASNLANKRSTIAANLALTSISLLWPTPSSALKRFRITSDGEPRVNYKLQIASKKQEIVGWQVESPLSICHIEPDRWKTLYSEAKCFMKIAGEMIACWTNTKCYTEASPLLRALSQSLFFFWKACHESSDLLSIIKFVAALEALTHGRKKSGILELSKMRLGLSYNQNFAKNKSLNTIVSRIYSAARSKTIHGVNEELLHDWSETRIITEFLTGNCLVECMIFSHDNWKEQDTSFLLRPNVV